LQAFGFAGAFRRSEMVAALEDLAETPAGGDQEGRGPEMAKPAATSPRVHLSRQG
jgi:hypothetical protein